MDYLSTYFLKRAAEDQNPDVYNLKLITADDLLTLA